MTTLEAAAVCRALGDQNRLKIISLLTTGEKCACELLKAFDITQPTLSHHMKILSDCNLVEARKDGKWIHYSLNCKTFSAFRVYISRLICK